MTAQLEGPFQPCFEAIPAISLDRWGVPLVFLRHRAQWEGTARGIDTAGHCIDTRLVFPLTDEGITLVSDDHRVRTTQLYEDGVYRHVTMIEEWRQPRP